MSTRRPEGVGIAAQILERNTTCARILTEVTARHFGSAAHLASYSGIAPVTRRPGTFLGEHSNAAGEAAAVA